VVDTVRSLLDGHIMLDRELASRGHYPPISILSSISRLMPSVGSVHHLEKVKGLISLLSAYTRSEELIRIGAYQAGSDPHLDKAIAALPSLTAFLQQTPDDSAPLTDTIERVLALPS
jgi:flagellum-specific ATP synthase